MSYRTVAQLDTTRRDVIQDLNDRNRMHKRLMSLYPDGLGDHPRLAINLIFAACPAEGTILFQSDMPPVVGPLNQARNSYFQRVVTKPTEDVGLQFADGDTVDFQLWFAAQERKTDTRKRVDISDEVAMEKASAVLKKAGLIVESIETRDRQLISAPSRGISYENVELTGTGVVTNAEHLRDAVIRGVGSGRLWGSGVLLIN